MQPSVAARLRLQVLLLICGLFSVPAAAQDAAATWQKVSQPVFDSARSAAVTGLSLARDRIRITLAEGVVQFVQPVEGLVFGAAFRGHGRVEVEPPNAAEAQQLRLFAGQERLAMDFTEAAFVFSDGTFEEVDRNARWGTGTESKLAEIYLDRQKQGEEVGAELLPRLVKSVLSADRKRTALFAADLKTNEKGWIHVRKDALEPEEILVGRWADRGMARLFDTWTSFPSGDRLASEAFRDPLAQEDFRIRSYEISATVTGAAELSATTRVHIEHRASGERLLLFELDSNLRVESVKTAEGQSLAFFQPREKKDRTQSYGDYVAVELPEPARAGQKQTFEFRYASKRVVRNVGGGNFFCQSYGWYPTRPNSFAARADFEITFRAPKKFTLVATGNKVSETTDGDSTITTWKSDPPLAVAGFAFGDYKIYSEKAGNVDIDIYANRQPDDFLHSIEQLTEPTLPGETGFGRPAMGSLSPSGLAKTMGLEMANTVRLFELYFGPYPYKRLAVTNIPYSYGQGWPGLIYLSALSFLDSTQRHNLGVKDHVRLTDFFRAHESSHQWWGHRVGWKSYHDQWLSEGFAEFSGNLYVLYRQNQKEYLHRLRKAREDLRNRDLRGHVYEAIGPIWMGHRLASSESPGAYNVLVYAKGGYVLSMLRMMLFDPRNPNHDQRFQETMQDFCRTYDNQAASTEDFKAIVEKHMIPAMDLDGNRRMDWFFRQYVYGTGMPHYRLQYDVRDAGDGKWLISGSVSQSGVPEGWKDALPLYLQHSGGQVVRLGIISVRGKVTPFELTVPVRPEKLVLNYLEDTLAEIEP